MSLVTELEELITDLGTDYKNVHANIGVLANLHTAATNLVAAINEVKATADAASGTIPDASTSAKGVIEIATNGEHLSGVDGSLAATPAGIASIKGVANGIASLNGSGQVPSAQLPSFVDDVLEYANVGALPGVGETGKIYVTLDTNKEYRWSGSVYVQLVASPGTTDALTEGSTNLYFTNSRADTRADGRITALVGDTTTDFAAYYAAAKA